MASQANYTATNLPSDGETIEAADVNTDLQGLIDEFNKQVPLSKISQDSDSAWTSYTVTTSANYTSVSTRTARYERIGKSVSLELDLSGTISASQTEITATIPSNLPFKTTTTGFQGGGCAINDASGGRISGHWYNVDGTTIGIRRYDGGNFGTGASTEVHLNIRYETSA